MLCAESSTCVGGVRCVPTDQVEACQGIGELSPCAVGEDDGVCIGGVCELAGDCGNGTLDEGEKCDDGNAFGGDSCSADCQTATCLVPVSHATVQELIDDDNCPLAYLSPGTYSEAITISSDVEMLPAGPGAVVLTAPPGGPIVTVESGATARLRDFEISGAMSEKCGGGVLNSGDLFLEDMVVRDNRSDLGAGICHIDGTLIILGGTIAKNTAELNGDTGGGGLYASSVVLASGAVRFENNEAVSEVGHARGGGFYIESTNATFTGSCQFAENSTSAGSGPFSGAFGGAGYANDSAVSIVGCGFSDNSAASNARAAGGALFVDRGNVAIEDNATFALNSAVGSESFGGGLAVGGGNATVMDSTFVMNSVGASSRGSGGGIALYENGSGTFAADRVVIDGNSVEGEAAGFGGGFAVTGSVPLVDINDSTISSNTLTSITGGGGGVSYEGNFDDSIVRVTRSTISGNSSNGIGGGVSVTYQGGVVTFDLTNSTVAKNAANRFAGINVAGAAPALNNRIGLWNTTVVENISATATSGGINAGAAGGPNPLVVSLSNSILAGNTAPQCSSPSGADFVGDGRNAITLRMTDCDLSALSNTQDLLFADLDLGPLGDNGGPTETYLPAAGSPLIDGGTNSCRGASGNLTTDQRNLSRTAPCDIGAVERQ